MTTIKLAYEGGGHFVAASLLDKDLADAHFKQGIPFEFHSERQRSMKHHRWLFQIFAKAYDNLPEDLADRYPNAEVLRARTLIKSGHCDVDEHIFDSHSEAHAVCFMLRTFEGQLMGARGYAVITISDCVVRIATARTIKFKRKDGTGLTQDEFRPVAERAVHELAVILGVDPVSLLEEVDNVPQWLTDADWPEWAA